MQIAETVLGVLRECRHKRPDARAAVTGEPDDRETVMSGSAGGRAEKDLPRQAPRRAADPTGWLMNHRRLARGYEAKPHPSEAMIYLAMINLMTRRLTAESTPSWRGT